MSKSFIYFDRARPENEVKRALGVREAVLTGECNTCPHNTRCGNDSSFKFPADAACMVLADAVKLNYSDGTATIERGGGA